MAGGPQRQSSAVGQALVARARTLGADLAGIASIDDLSRAGEVRWPEGARSIMVVAVAHPADRPELDWWFGRSDPPGNRVLAAITQGLCDWIPGEYGFRAVHLAYHVERGGAYLKDAAVLAGLGAMGFNNLLVTPEYGPRVRLRALTLDVELPPTGPVAFDPCAECDRPCRRACPQRAFVEAGGRDVPGAGRLPARDGCFSRPSCEVQMDLDVGQAAPLEAGDCKPGSQVAGSPAPVMVPIMMPVTTPVTVTTPVIRYCRACELSCPVGAFPRRATSQ